MENKQAQPERQSVTEMVLKIYVGHYLRNNLTTDDMIEAFSLMEQNPDGKSRIKKLTEKGYMRDLAEEQIREAIRLVEDYPDFFSTTMEQDVLPTPSMAINANEANKLNLAEKVSRLNKAGFLLPDLTPGNMICVFDLIEHNDDGEARINRLIEEACVIHLNLKQIDDAIQILND